MFVAVDRASASRLRDSLARRTWGSDSPLESVSLPSHPVAALVRGAGPITSMSEARQATFVDFPIEIIQVTHTQNVTFTCYRCWNYNRKNSFYKSCPRFQKEVMTKGKPLTSRKRAKALFDEVLKSGCDFFGMGVVLNCQKCGHHSHAGCSCNHARVCRKDETSDGEVAVSIQMEARRHTCDHWIRKVRSVPA